MTKRFAGNRVGALSILTSLLENHEEASALMREIVPIRVEHSGWGNRYEIIAYSPHFDVVEPGSLCPEYKAVFTKGEDGKVTFERFDRYELWHDRFR